MVTSKNFTGKWEIQFIVTQINVVFGSIMIMMGGYVKKHGVNIEIRPIAGGLLQMLCAGNERY